MSDDVTSDIDESGFDRAVLERSMDLPVLVDFWADWCAPCHALAPVLDKLASELAGDFVLVKVNADESRQLAQRFGVKGLPTVKLFRHGEVVDGFVGVQPENVIRQLIERHRRGPADQLLDEATGLAVGNPEAAAELLRRGIELEPDNHRLKLALADVLIGKRDYTDADTLLAGLPARIGTTEAVKALEAKSFIGRLAVESADSDDDRSQRLRRAAQLLQTGQPGDGLEMLEEILKDAPGWRDGLARRVMLAAFALLGQDNELVSRWRRRIASLLN